MDGTATNQPETASAPRRGRRILKRILIGVLGTIAAVLALALVLYLFGGPGGATREVRAHYESLLLAGQAPEVENRFVIPIPGCRCHSDDPILIVEHAERRIRDCFSCH